MYTMVGHTAAMKKRRRRRHQLCCSSEPQQLLVAERSCACSSSSSSLLFSAAASSSSVLLSCSAPAPAPPPRLVLHHPLGVAAALALAVLLLASSNAVPVSASRRSSSSVAGEELVWSPKMTRIQRRLGRINKPAVRSVQSLDGDIIDCVGRHKQHALDHPLLRKHKIQRVPPQIPTSPALGATSAANGSSSRTAWQTWHHVGHCPRGTVPVRRTSAEDVMRARSLFRFGRKKKKQQLQLLAPVPPAAANAPDIITGNGHEHAIAYTSAEAAGAGGSSVYGAKATISVWDPAIQESNGFSLSQLWILSGSFNGSDLNSIEAGWQVSPELYGDSRPRLFTYWTSDAYEATGCYNALCPGFVQTSSRIAIGASISPVSSLGGSQYDMTLLIWKDPKLGNWWLSYGDGGKEQLVGYWPAELFTHLSDHATMVEWGGEVVNTRPDGAHTATQMGSGRFAGEGFGRASYFRNLETVDADNSLAAVPLDAIQTLAEDAGCYDIQKAYDDGGGKHSGGGWGAHFYYGGPGHNPACP